jgi:preprotein translocase subunit SecE
MKKLIEFLKAAWVELKKVSWPGRKEIIASTVVVVIVGFLLMLYIGLIDFLLAKAVKFIFG